MIVEGTDRCPKCGGELKYYDSIKRTVKGRNGRKINNKLRRLKCTNCKSVHREMPKHISPFKQYDKRIIEGMNSKEIDPYSMGFEDYPSQTTLDRWRKESTRVG